MYTCINVMLGAYLDALYPEAQGGCGRKGLPPLHVARLSDGLCLILLGGGLIGVHCHHLVIHILREGGREGREREREYNFCAKEE